MTRTFLALITAVVALAWIGYEARRIADCETERGRSNFSHAGRSALSVRIGLNWQYARRKATAQRRCLSNINRNI